MISLIIPTHNRCLSLQRLLDALQKQTYPLDDLEVVVVADGCQDNTIEMLEKYEAPFKLVFLEQPGSGAAVARNKGAEKASGSLLIFLDDDIKPSEYFVEAHVRAHSQKPDQVVIGYLPPKLANQSSFFQIRLWAWWEEKFYIMGKAGHRYTYEDLLSGNFSLPASLFQQVGGFDSRFRCREDYELGARLLKAGADLIFVKAAMGDHCDEVTDLDRSLRRKRQEGKADILFGRCHPDLMYKLRVASFGESSPWLEKIVQKFIFQFSQWTDLLAFVLRALLNLLEMLKMRQTWEKLNNRLHGYWYLRGMIDELKTYKGLISYLQGGEIRPNSEGLEIEIDLKQGLEKAEQLIDEQRPVSLRIRYGEHPIGRIAPCSGAERLRSVHLRPLLMTDFAWQLLQAVNLETSSQDILLPFNTQKQLDLVNL
ncbi:glycosyltransferase family 2 protein [Gloeothece verrucosa]|uniref:Glycosyl transferase family 2 n=1 Tax=Gloeothece verrucosa (strain PCC 7822) TaxID=497965 RepID=E0UL15_GLOV7|nr:glycosyltransferase [Gloeothece verrucosa]ADN17645.1 glycosyl transferase family 2 [Gloeothece verrucosa PCC 7822]